MPFLAGTRNSPENSEKLSLICVLAKAVSKMPLVDIERKIILMVPCIMMMVVVVGVMMMMGSTTMKYDNDDKEGEAG